LKRIKPLISIVNEQYFSCKTFVDKRHIFISQVNIISNNQRLPEIDLIRGVALLGIFLMNIDFMGNSPVLVEDWSDNFSNSFDQAAGRLKFLFLAQRFIGIFSLLFGLSIAIQQKNFQNSGIPFNSYYFKRIGILIVIGIIQVLFFYMGDILIIYGLLGIVLFFFFKLSNRVLIISAILIFFVPAILESLQLTGDFLSNIENHYTSESITEVYQSGTLLEMMKARLTEFFYYDLTGISWNRTSFSMMIIGYLIGRNDLHITYLKYRKKLKIVFFISILFFAAFALHFLFMNADFSFWLNILYNFHILVSITTYVLIILFIYKINIFKKFASLITHAGKMSLSNYLFQSVVCAFIFTNYGLSLFAKTTPTDNVLIVSGIYSIQIVLSYFYLRKFKTGPLESVWHKLAY